MLAAGTYRIDRPLVVLQDVTLRGAGRGRTRIVSTSADAAVLLAAPVRLGLRDLEVRHTGAKVASVLLLRAGTTVLDRVSVLGGSLAPAARASAATVPDLTSGGNGVVALSSAGTVLRDVRLEDNEAGGLVAAGRACPRISGSTMTGNALCGKRVGVRRGRGDRRRGERQRCGPDRREQGPGPASPA